MLPERLGGLSEAPAPPADPPPDDGDVEPPPAVGALRSPSRRLSLAALPSGWVTSLYTCLHACVHTCLHACLHVDVRIDVCEDMRVDMRVDAYVHGSQQGMAMCMDGMG